MIGLLTFVTIILVIVQHFSAVEVIGLLMIVDFAMKVEYGGQKTGANPVQKPAFSSDKRASLLLTND